MTTLTNLHMRKQQLEDQLKRVAGAQERERIEGELMKIDIALGFLEKETPDRPAASE
jgi:hypothetical protein